MTDFDEAMVAAADARLARFADRANVRQADAARLPFPDGGFDAVVSFHHAAPRDRLQAALGEGGPGAAPRWRALGYDLVASRPARWLHQAEGARHRLMAAGELRDRLAAVPVEAVRLRPGLAGLAVRFTARRTPG